ncbi:hypothetical protein GCM10010413_57310 [Promicromonospora sukumoe]|uniref:Uncharacterized protein n=1 Tax=Promicromonospora sukumoe TaxID=88382 RepID=A0A7W3JCJ5_9MICO|nr:hypothetical protein [Promicromonospora sukumoe]MBA8810292.1 hypothetical protein [Promicromonospora sukumoe]
MESTAGLTAVALFVLWLGYWMPSMVRRRAELADARVPDRFSGGLRIVAMSGSARRGGAMVNDGNRRGSGQGVPRVAHPTPRQGLPLQIMVRGRPLTAERIRRVERRARRAARARRRFIVSIFLLVSSVVAWALVGFGQLHWGAAVATSAMLLFVLFLGRRAARAARRADARWQATVRAARQRATQARALANGGPYAPRNRAQVVGLATRGSDTQTQAIPRVGGKNVLDEILDGPEKPQVIEVSAEVVEESPAGGAGAAGVAGGAPTKVAEPQSGRAWDPVPVPLPTYVTKPKAPQRTPAALPAALGPSSASSAKGASAGGSGRAGGSGSASSASGPTTAAGAAGAATSGAAGSGADAVAEDELLRGEPPRMKSETLGQPLEEILARRRAAG